MSETHKIALLNFSSGIHLGTGIGENYDRCYDILHSDTLSAALCSIAASINLNVADFLQAFKVSSAFPVVNESVFMPLPPDKQCIKVEGSDSMHKRLKRLKWIEQPLWEQLALNGMLTITPSQISACGTAVTCENNSDICLSKQILEQKVQVSRVGENSKPYFFDRLYLGKNVKWGIMFDVQKNYHDIFTKAFTILSQSGIGTSRSIGNGLFEVEFSEININAPQDATASQLLSLWIPCQEELSENVLRQSCYTLIKRGGYMAGATQVNLRNIVKKSISMIESGSIIKLTAPQGRIVDLRPQSLECHNVWRDGRAMYLPFNSH